MAENCFIANQFKKLFHLMNGKLEKKAVVNNNIID